MQEILSNLFGTYTPVTYTSSDGVEIIPPGLAGVDWPYVVGVLLFAICLLSFFKLLGRAFK